MNRRLALAWIWLGVIALVGAGLLALALALSRTPGVQDLFPGGEFFRVALVAHVDLSVLAWFIAGAGLLWSWHARRAGASELLAFAASLAGTLLIALAPFLGAGAPLMNNYVPVLQHPLFFAGLGLLGGGLALAALDYLLAHPPVPARDAIGLRRAALGFGALCAPLALGCVALSARGLPAGAGGEYLFDLLFWGGGHVLQIMHTVLMLVAFHMLLEGTGVRLPGPSGLQYALFALCVAPLAALPWLYAQPVDSAAHLVGFTTLMRWGGVASIPLLLLVIAGSLRGGVRDLATRPARAALLCALALFCGGGLTGFMIQGSNTVIPAHYHGSIVGVTMAYMGVVFLLLPQLGRPLAFPRAAAWQPYLYGIGQVLHVTGLAWTGGHGVKRKVAGAAQGLDSVQELLGMALMGLGGLVAVAGGVLFLVIAIASLCRVAVPAPGLPIAPAHRALTGE
jgi:hypothetical protein